MMAWASNHRRFTAEHARANYASSYLHSGTGAGCRNFSRPTARGRAFSLDILFYRLRVARTVWLTERQRQYAGNGQYCGPGVSQTR